MIASENMASSFQDFLAETFASYSPDDSHLALETIFSCLYFSTCSWRVPAIYVVSISLLLASLGRRSIGQLLKAELAHHSSFCVLHTAKPARALLRSTAAVFITRKIDNGKKASQGKSNTLQFLRVFARPSWGWVGQRSDDLDTWIEMQNWRCNHAANTYRGSWVQPSTKKHEKIAAIRLG